MPHCVSSEPAKTVKTDVSDWSDFRVTLLVSRRSKAFSQFDIFMYISASPRHF